MLRSDDGKLHGVTDWILKETTYTLTEEEKEKLENELGEEMTEKCIKKLDEYIETSGKTYKNHYLVCKGWVVDAVNEDEQKRISPTTGRIKSKRAQELDDLTDMSFAWAEREDGK